MITVTIPAQTFDQNKYVGAGCRCYLEEALDKAGYASARVSGFGRTKIGHKWYAPSEPFESPLLREAFERGEDVTVTLIENN